MSTNKNIELVKNLIEQNGGMIHPMTSGVMVYAYLGKHSLVCSWLGSNLTVSISVNEKANLKKNTDLVKRVFGKKFSVTHLSDNPLEGKNANYFSLQFLH